MDFDDYALHARGTSTFTDDIPLPKDALFACPVVSQLAHGLIDRIDAATARASTGVVDVLTARDIPGVNNIGNIEADEVLLADTKVVYQGQPIALVVAESETAASEAVKLVNVEYRPLPAVFDARSAFRQGSTIGPPRIFSLGDVDQAWRECDVIVEGSAISGAQEHVYLECQTAIAYPLENQTLKIVSATQSPGMVQRLIARVLACPMHQIEVDILRLGGGFGGKEEQATPWAVLAALATHRLRRPVRLTLPRQQDMRLTGKRHPYDSDFKIGLDRSGKILAYEVFFYQNAGAVADLSPAILERTLLHAGNSYFIPNIRATGVSCRTHLPPNTAFRGFGGPQAMFALESALFKAARKLGMDPARLQARNLLQEGDAFPYGMVAYRCLAQSCWQNLQIRYRTAQRQQAIETFNAKHPLTKKAMALMPICFGISFTATFLNQASALVHVYSDGSVSVSCGAVEMGQGVREKIRKIAAQTLAIDEIRIKVESTDTARIANMSPTAASVGADLNGQATLLACRQIQRNLISVAARLLGCAAEPERISLRQEQVWLDEQPTTTDWKTLVGQTYISRIPLSAHAHYATPGLFFDRCKEKGQPFAYHVYGCASVEVTVDCLRGTYTIDQVNMIHDAGRCLSPMTDLGQLEGGVVQGLGWMTLEEIVHDQQGRLLTDNLTAYKIPDIHSAPIIDAEFLPDVHPPAGIMHSKAIGEPPFMYGIGAYFALTKAILAFNPHWEPKFIAPMTPEKLLLALYSTK